MSHFFRINLAWLAIRELREGKISNEEDRREKGDTGEQTASSQFQTQGSKEEMSSCGTCFLFPILSPCWEQMPMTGGFGRILELVVSIYL